MPYNFAADSFHTKKLCSRLSPSEVHFLMEIGRFAFLRPPLGNLGATYGDHLRLIGKRVVVFLLALIELFSLGVTAEELRAIIGWKSAISLQWGRLTKFHLEGVAPTNHSSSQKTRLNVFSYGIKIWTDLSSILSRITRVTDRQTDRRTDRILIARPRLHFMQRGKKTKVMCTSNQKRTKIKILIDGHRVEEVDKFEYLVIGLYWRVDLVQKKTYETGSLLGRKNLW